MPSIGFTVEGAQGVSRGLHTFSTKLPPTIGFEIRKIIRKAKRVFVQYPPQRPGQTYVRTHRLASSWQILDVGGADIGHGLENRTPYARWVHGNEFGDKQAWMHLNRWPAFRPTVVGFVQEAPENVRKNLFILAASAGLEIG